MSTATIKLETHFLTLYLFCVILWSLPSLLNAQSNQQQQQPQPQQPLQTLQPLQPQQDSIYSSKKKPQNVVAEMQVVCLSDAILLKMNTNTAFNGMVYAKEAPSSPNCVSEFNATTNMTFKLPLKACGTLHTDLDDGIEYFNTVVVQPHMRLMTNQGKGYHIRCKYQTRERTIANTQFNVSASFQMQDAPKTTTPLLATASMPSCTMKIFRKGRSDVAESVKIGDKLVMVIEIDRQDMYGMRISNCVVRDGLNVAEQQLIDFTGCPLDEAIMPAFEYSNNYTRAAVYFPAHKFPHTSSVYYQCNISLCINNGNCVPNECRTNVARPSTTNGSQASSTMVTANGAARRKRHSSGTEMNQSSSMTESAAKPVDDMSFDVYSGLYVSDGADDERIDRDLDDEVGKGSFEPEYRESAKQFGPTNLQSPATLIAIILVAMILLGLSYRYGLSRRLTRSGSLDESRFPDIHGKQAMHAKGRSSSVTMTPDLINNKSMLSGLR